MGIYSNGSIYGIQMYDFNDDGLLNVLLEEKNNQVMSYHQMREAYLFYTQLNKNSQIHFKIYTECVSTLSHSGDCFMMWHPFSSDAFLKTFGV